MKERSWHQLRALAAASAVGALALLAGGCGGRSGQHPRQPSGHRGGAASSPAASPETGSQLRALFPTAAQLPPGWALSNGNGQETDSGSALTRPPYRATLPALSCQRWQGVDAQFLLSGDQASSAQLTLMIGHGKNASLGSINLAGYFPGWAARQFVLISSLAHHRCGPFTKRDEITRARVKMKPTVSAASGLGDQALLIRIRQTNGPLPDGTYYPGDYLLVFRVGSYLAGVDAPDIPGQSPARAAYQVASQLAGRLQHLS